MRNSRLYDCLGKRRDSAPGFKLSVRNGDMGLVEAMLARGDLT